MGLPHPKVCCLPKNRTTHFFKDSEHTFHAMKKRRVFIATIDDTYYKHLCLDASDFIPSTLTINYSH